MATVPVVDRYDAIQYDGTNKAAVAAVIPNYIFVAETGAGLQFKSGSGTWFCPPNGWIVYSTRYATVLAQWNTTAAFEGAYRALVDGASLVALQSGLTAVQADVIAAQADIAAVQADMTSAQTDIAASQGDITASQGDITALQTDVTSLETSMTTAQADITSLETTLTALAAAVTGAVLASGAGTFNFGPGNTTVNVDINPAQAGTSYDAFPQLFGGVSIGALSITGHAVVDTNTVSVTVNNTGLLSLGASVLVTVTA